MRSELESPMKIDNPRKRRYAPISAISPIGMGPPSASIERGTSPGFGDARRLKWWAPETAARFEGNKSPMRN